MLIKKWMIFIALILIIAVIYFSAASFLNLQPKQKEVFENNDIPKREQKALTFVTEKMSGAKLSVYTNYLNNKNDNPELASGQEILSESQGLLLLYFVNRNEKENFDVCFDWTMKHLLLDNGTFSWLKKDEQIASTNALIDDLRLARAFLSAYEKWHDEKYLQDINSVSEALLTYNIEVDLPIDFYDLDYGCKSKEISIAYLDLYTMRKLGEQIDSRWKIPYENSLDLMKNAKLEGTGLYRFQYDTEDGTYTDNNEIALVQSAYGMLHLAEVGEYDLEGLDWLWHEYEKFGKIYSTYSSKNYEPVSELESTALYALLARTYYLAGEYQKAETFMEACERYQILNENSAIYGSFGNESNQEVYSFDNLQYLLSSSMIYQ